MKSARIPLLFALLAITSLLAADGAEAEHNFGKWEKEISAFELADRTNPPLKDGLVFIGSSTIKLWKTLAQDFPEHRVINRGFGGSEIVDSTHFADRVIFPYQPRAVFVRAGGNDLWAGKTPERVFADFKEFVTTIHSKFPQAGIVFISLSPSISRWSQAEKEKAVNTMVQEFVKQNPRLRYVDTWTLPLGPDGQPRPELFLPDKLHFNADGYKLLVERVRPFLPK